MASDFSSSGDQSLMEEASSPSSARNGRPLRANRGKNPNARWLVEDPQPKKAVKRQKASSGSTAKKSKPEEYIVEGEVDCRCEGTVADDKTMAECEKCKNWQHIVCEFGVDDESALPKPEYHCYKCRNDESGDTSSTSSKIAQKSDQKPKSALDSIDSYDDKVRRSVANNFFDIIIEKSDIDDVDPPTNKATEILAVAIEHSLYTEFAEKQSGAQCEVGAAYREQYRTLSFNLKDSNNRWLRGQLISGKLTPKTFVRMTSEELRNPKLQQLANDIHDESLRETIIKEMPKPPLEVTRTGTAEVNQEPTHLEYEKEDLSNEADLNEAMKEPMGPALDVGQEAKVQDEQSLLEIPVWVGTLKLSDGSISAKANGIHVSGQKRSDWPSLTPSSLLEVDGLVEIIRAQKYLTEAGESSEIYKLTSMAIVSDENKLAEFYDYLRAHNRYGTLKHTDLRIKEAYVIPYTEDSDLQFLGLFTDQLDFLKHLNTEHDSNKLLIAVYVIE